MGKYVVDLACFLKIPSIRKPVEVNRRVCSGNNNHEIRETDNYCSICGFKIQLKPFIQGDTYASGYQVIELAYKEAFKQLNKKEIKAKGFWDNLFENEELLESLYGEHYDFWSRKYCFHYLNNSDTIKYSEDISYYELQLENKNLNLQVETESFKPITTSLIDSCFSSISEKDKKLIKLLSWYLGYELKPEFGLLYYYS